MLSGLRRDGVVQLVRLKAEQGLSGLLWQAGKATQRKGSGKSEPQTELRRSSPPSVAAAELVSIDRVLESWQDLEASVKTVLRVLGCR